MMFGVGVAAGVGAFGVGVLVWCWRLGRELLGPEGLAAAHRHACQPAKLDNADLGIHRERRRKKYANTPKPPSLPQALARGISHFRTPHLREQAGVTADPTGASP